MEGLLNPVSWKRSLPWIQVIPDISQALGQCLLFIQAVIPLSSFPGLLLKFDRQQECLTPKPNFNHVLISSYVELFQIYCFLIFLSLKKKSLISCISEAQLLLLKMCGPQWKQSVSLLYGNSAPSVLGSTIGTPGWAHTYPGRSSQITRGRAQCMDSDCVRCDLHGTLLWPRVTVWIGHSVNEL